MLYLRGNPAEIGAKYGDELRDRIAYNIKTLVRREGLEPLPLNDDDFKHWLREQESIIGRNWPWILEEISAVAASAGFSYEDMLIMNFRAWQYQYYGAQPKLDACSSFAITLADGNIACAGALDDPAELYCGPVRYCPDGGYSFVTFPLTGTCWASRCHNSAGLSMGISSQILPGLRRLPSAVNQDIAMRAIIQTCSTVDDVRDFCKEYPFTLNLVCVDAAGSIFCAHNTAAGLREMPADSCCAMTNHVTDDSIIHWLSECGVREFPEDSETRKRRGAIMSFLQAKNGKCSLDEVREFITLRGVKGNNILHSETLYVTLSVPQVNKTILEIWDATSSSEMPVSVDLADNFS